ncbi:TPA: polysaccharide biosynthesis protein, partial [bacterium]|nr:polysaccharide biosynthesis protein [bacterium]
MKRLVIIIFDAAGIASALIIAAAVRFDANIPPEELKLIMLSMPAVIIGKLVALMLFHCDQWSFKYAGSMELRRLLAALSLGSLLGWAFTYLVGPDGTSRAVLLLEPLFSLFLLGAFRFGLRLLPDRIPAIAEDQPGARKVIIIGAGDAGVITLKEIRRHPNSDMVVVGFIDDDPKKHGLWIDGVRVIGGRNEISSAVKSLSVDELIIAIPSAGGETIRELIDACREVKTRFRVVPGLLSIIKGTVTFSRIREIKPEDLLGRETTEIEPELFRKDFDGKKVLVTGAGGSIGSELCRQL